MSQKFDYTAVAQRFAARHPVLAYVMTQIFFWIIANVLLGIIMHLQSLSITETANLPASSRLLPIIMIAIIVGVLYGLSFGLTDYYFDKNIFRKKPLGKIILFKTIISLAVLILLLMFTRYILLYIFIPYSVGNPKFFLSQISWRYLFNTMLIYYFVMTIIINFINQVNKK